MKEIQAVNAARKQAVVDGLSPDEAMKKITAPGDALPTGRSEVQ